MGGSTTPFRLDGKVAVVTGAARGIGRAAAVALARAGADIAGIDIAGSASAHVDFAPATPEDLAATGQLVTATGQRWMAVTLDQRSLPALREAATSIKEAFGGIDILFANGGIQAFKPILEMEDPDWHDQIDINLTGTMNAIRAFAPQLVTRGAGRIVVTSSTQGQHGTKNGSAYSASKWGIIGLMKSAALELGEHAITVNALIPGLIDTVLTRHEDRYAQALQVAGKTLTGDPAKDEEAARAGLVAKSPLGVPWITPEDVAPMVVFLASDEARMVSAASFPVTAGDSANVSAYEPTIRRRDALITGEDPFVAKTLNVEIPMSAGPKVRPSLKPYTGPAGGWGSVRSVGEILVREHILAKGSTVLIEQNKAEGYMCVSCAWAKPAKPHPFEYCENGAKATAWEITTNRTDAEFFAEHTLTELESWLDYSLEEQGRLTEPMRWDAASDKYVAVSWHEAFAEIGRELRAMDPHAVDFYTSGRAGLEAAYMYQLFARLFGSNNLPDCSNMCHESSSVGLPESLGASVGTATLSDFENTDCIFYIAQNVGTSSPRLLHDLQDAVDRGVEIVTINPLRERGLERFINPQAPGEMLTRSETPISSQYHQVKVGGDIAALIGICKALIEADDARRANHVRVVAGDDDKPREPSEAASVAFAASMAAADAKHVLDHDFIQEHTVGFEAFAETARGYAWAELEQVSGLARADMEKMAYTYASKDAVLLVYGMGLTQHVMGVQNVHMVCNLALLRGNVGKPGANICAVRGHSNVQGQRTVGITEKPSLVPLDKLAELYKFTPPRWEGHSTVDTCKAILAGDVQGFVSLGGNFLRAVPETEAMEAAWRKLRLTVQIATKLNRSHVIHGEVAYLLPCLGRLEVDEQASGPQAVSMESSVAHFHGSRGKVKPASPHLRSEPAIIAGIAKATLGSTPDVPWDRWVGNYGTVRDAIEETYPETFKEFNKRLFQPGGFPRPLPARERKWVTASGKANFITPDRLTPELNIAGDPADTLLLATLRSNDQFNTTIYGYHDRFRGVKGTRHVVFINKADLTRLGFRDGDVVDLTTALSDGVHRQVKGFRVVEYDIPAGCCGAYYPETNPLVPLMHHDPKSKVPAYKAIPVRISVSVR